MDAFVQPLYELADFDAIIRQLKKPGIVQVSGCLDSQKAHFTNGLLREFPFRLIVAENDLKAKAFYEDFRLYDPEVLYYPARDLIFYQADIHGNLLTRQRIQVLRALLEREKVTIVTSIDSCLDCLVPLAVWKEKVIKIRNDSEIDLDRMKRHLLELGYEWAAQVEVPGQFSIRGGIMDVFSLTEDNPWRIELWGDEVDSIRSFDAESQRSIENLEEITIYPATEVVLDKETIRQGIKAIEKEAQKSQKKFRDEMKTEEGARVRQIAAELKDQLEEMEHIAGAESFVRYFYKKNRIVIGISAGEHAGCDRRAKPVDRTCKDNRRRIPGEYDSPSGKGVSSARTDGSNPKPSGSSASVSSDAYAVVVHDGATGNRVELHYGDAADCKIGQPVQQQF